MRGKIIFVLITTVLVFALGIQAGLSKEKKEAGLDTTKIMHKLDQVLANQAKILQQFGEIKQELSIIKVRASK